MFSNSIRPLLLYCPSYLSIRCSASIPFSTCLKHSASHLVTLKSQLLDQYISMSHSFLPFHNLLQTSNTIQRSSASQFLLTVPFNLRHQAKINHLTYYSCNLLSITILNIPGFSFHCTAGTAHFKKGVRNRMPKQDPCLNRWQNGECREKGRRVTDPVSPIYRASSYTYLLCKKLYDL